MAIGPAGVQVVYDDQRHLYLSAVGQTRFRLRDHQGCDTFCTELQKRIDLAGNVRLSMGFISASGNTISPVPPVSVCRYARKRSDPRGMS